MSKFTSGNFGFLLIVGVLVLAYLYLRNGAEYFTGNSGGSYWDHMSYCREHPWKREVV